jgi:hypothetical protein
MSENLDVVKEVVENTVSNVENTVSNVENTINDVENTVAEVKKLDLLQLFQDLLVINRSKLDNFSIKLSDNMQKYILVLMKDNSAIFSDIENTLKRIIVDKRIDSKDIPDLLIIVGKIYEIVYKSKNIKNKAEYFDLIKNLLFSAFVLYIENNVEDGKEMIDAVMKIIEACIDLIKLKSSLKVSKFCKFL